MSRLSHAFSVEHAEKYGVECAILISHFQFWIEQNQVVGRNFHDDRTWMYQSQKEISACYPYWSEDTVYRTIKKLVDCEVLIKGNYNKSKFDQTSWYAFKNEKNFTKPRNRGNDTTTPQNPDLKPAEPIPDTNPDTYPKKQQQPPPDSAAVFSNSENKQQPTMTAKLRGVNIPVEDKIEIVTKYDPKTIDHAIDWATHPSTKITKSVAAAIKWACVHKPEIPKEKKSEKIPVNPEGYNKTYLREVYKVAHQNGYRLDQLGLQDGHEFLKTEHEKIYFKDVGFLEQIANFLRKKSVDCRNIYDMIKACQQDLHKQMA